MKIQRLSPQVFNQIAAGEVIERPASVVKELLENALDAGATTISIELNFGGLNLIKISDNGHGIAEEDLPLTIAAHATSKLTQLSDLTTLTTMGFRGEALASIASVSRFQLYSKPATQLHGMLLRLDEQGIDIHPFARNQGTTVEIRDLFYNTPVRKAFLKSERQEYQAIDLTIKQFALAAPQVAITVNHNQKQTLHLPKADCAASHVRRIKKLFGQAFLNDAITIEHTHEFLTIQGWISQHNYQRSQRDKQWVYLNQRIIKDKLVLQTITQAYQDLLHPGRYPACILYLTIAPDQVDINVHPTKQEVRFRDSRTVHTMLLGALTKPLQRQIPAPAPHPSRSLPSRFAPETELRITGISEGPWRLLNRQFAILNMKNSPYLIDLLQIHQQYVAQILQTTEYPFPQRALLVPIRCTIEHSGYAYLEQQRPVLLELGIQFDFVSLQYIVIRSIPLHLPLLDLEQFFKVIQQTNFVRNALIQQLIACQTFDAYNMSPSERQALFDYCMQNWDSLLQHRTGVLLDTINCRQIMRQIAPLSVLESV